MGVISASAKEMLIFAVAGGRSGRLLSGPPLQHARPISLGQGEAGTLVSIPAAALAGLLAKGMHQAGYQVLMINPEGDYRGDASTAGRCGPPGSLAELKLNAAAAGLRPGRALYPLQHKRLPIPVAQELHRMLA
jgi:hypothetical protein